MRTALPEILDLPVAPRARHIIRGLPLPLATYRRRRARARALLAAAFGGQVPLLLMGCTEPRLRAQRQDPWFDYFCGCVEPDAALLLDPAHEPQDTLFLDQGDLKRIAWDGPRLGPRSHAARAHGIEAVAPATALERRVREAARRAGGVLAMCTRTYEPGFQAEQCEAWRARLPAVEVLNAEPVLVRLRMVKDADEIALLRRAVQTTRQGLLAVLPLIPRLASESEVAALLEMHYRREGGSPLAFPTIVGSGLNGATLHYLHNDQPLARRQPILIDSGATVGGYCADVTRTVPQHGRFDQRRFREVYELVLRANEIGRGLARPGVTRQQLNEAAWAPIVAAGFPSPYNLTHSIGLDVHDPADYREPFQPGMVVSNEPGIYLPDEGFGVRIEDDLLITADGCEELTSGIPKTIADLEGAMLGQGRRGGRARGARRASPVAPNRPGASSGGTAAGSGR